MEQSGGGNPAASFAETNDNLSTKICLSFLGKAMVPREGIIRNHRHDEPLFVLSMVA